MKFLNIFYDVNILYFGSLYVTSNTTFIHLSLIQSEINDWTKDENCNSIFYFLVMDMKKKSMTSIGINLKT